MSTIAEIEAAVERLRREDQQRLKDWLQARLTTAPPARAPGLWLAKLARLRSRVATGRAGNSTEAILNDLREDRFA